MRSSSASSRTWPTLTASLRDSFDVSAHRSSRCQRPVSGRLKTPAEAGGRRCEAARATSEMQAVSRQWVIPFVRKEAGPGGRKRGWFWWKKRNDGCRPYLIRRYFGNLDSEPEGKWLKWVENLTHLDPLKDVRDLEQQLIRDREAFIERRHGGRRPRRTGRSSNHRTADSNSANRGSIPRRPPRG